MSFLSELKNDRAMAYTLSDLMRGLPEDRQLAMALHFAGLGLPIWEEFAADVAKRSYYDGVVGMHHEISATLPSRALELGRVVLASPDYCRSEAGNSKLKALVHEFIEPIVALQDDDWELPDAVKLIFYAHSNLVEHLSGATNFLNGESSLYVTVNQAIDAIETSGRMTMPQLREELRAFSGGRAPSES